MWQRCHHHGKDEPDNAANLSLTTRGKRTYSNTTIDPGTNNPYPVSHTGASPCARATATGTRSFGGLDPHWREVPYSHVPLRDRQD